MDATVQEVINQLLQQFTQEEAGNKVTRNNMLGLSMQIGMAFEGKITLQKSEPKAVEEK